MYQVRFYDGDYPARQAKANADKCVGYVEQHFNSSNSSTADYAVVVVGSNASQTSKNWGRWYSAACAHAFGVRDNGILVGGYSGRGDGNLRHTNMPAILLEPLFGSTLRHADIIRNEGGQQQLAQILAESIQRFFPNGGLIAFSIGHKGRPSKPKDRGAAILGGGSEADFAEPVLKKAAAILEAIGAPRPERVLRVAHNNAIIFEQVLDEEAVTTWDAVRQILSVSEA